MVAKYKTALAKAFGAQNLGSVPLTLSNFSPLIYGDIYGLQIDFNNVALAGTLTGTVSMSNIVQALLVMDNTGKTIYELDGNDLMAMAFYTSNKGVSLSNPILSTSAQSFSIRYHLPISMNSQPVVFQITLAPYTIVAGATGGSVGSITVTAMYSLDGSGKSQVATVKIIKNIYSTAVVGDNELQAILSSTSNPVNDIVVRLTNGAGNNLDNLNYVTFRASSVVEIEKETLQHFKISDELNYQSGHQAGLYKLPIEAFIKTGETYLDVNLSATVNTIIVYQFTT